MKRIITSLIIGVGLAAPGVASESDDIIKELARVDALCASLETLRADYKVTVRGAEMCQGKKITPAEVEIYYDACPELKSAVSAYLSEQNRYRRRLIERLIERLKESK